MNCPICNNEMSKGIYICTTTDNRVLDSSDNLVFIYKTNEIESNDEEIGIYNDVYYCSTDNYFKPYDKQIESEQDFINSTFQIHNSTKTIDEAIQVFVDTGLGTTEEIKNMLKSSNPSVTDWSF
tara:strand:+ start:251 stop:622 length:372 start_codon:yes stop_codon:yes gene_type:complete